MHLQKEVKSNQKQPSCKKACGPCCEKRCEIQGGSQEMDVMIANGKNFNNDNSGEFDA